jgi:hypothetical protein
VLSAWVRRDGHASGGQWPTLWPTLARSPGGFRDRRRTLVGRMSTTPSASVRIPGPLRAQLTALARAEDRSLSAIVIALLDRGVAERAREVAVVRELIREFDATVVEDAA